MHDLFWNLFCWEICVCHIHRATSPRFSPSVSSVLPASLIFNLNGCILNYFYRISLKLDLFFTPYTLEIVSDIYWFLAVSEILIRNYLLWWIFRNFWVCFAMKYIIILNFIANQVIKMSKIQSKSVRIWLDFNHAADSFFEATFEFQIEIQIR